MVKPDITEEIKVQDNIHFDIEQSEAITGGRNKSKFLLYKLKNSMPKAERIDIIVSFLMESGVRMILDDLKQALELRISGRYFLRRFC